MRPRSRWLVAALSLHAKLSKCRVAGVVLASEDRVGRRVGLPRRGAVVRVAARGRRRRRPGCDPRIALRAHLRRRRLGRGPGATLSLVGVVAEAITFAAPVVLVAPVVWGQLCKDTNKKRERPLGAGSVAHPLLMVPLFVPHSRNPLATCAHPISFRVSPPDIATASSASFRHGS